MIIPFSFNYGGIPFSEYKYEMKETESGREFLLPDGLKITQTVREYPAFGATECVQYYEYTGQTQSRLINELWDADVMLPMEPNPPKVHDCYRTRYDACHIVEMTGIIGCYETSDKLSADEFRTIEHYMEPRWKRTYTNKNGRSSDGTFPIFDANRGNDGYIIAIGWSGDWKAEFSRTEDGLNYKCGLKEVNFCLNAGERVRGISTLILPYHEGQTKARNSFRRLMKEHFSPIGKDDVRPKYGISCCEAWGGITTEEMIHRIDTFRQYGVKFDYYWLDAGWYGDFSEPCTCTRDFKWSDYVGDWTPNPYHHPDGLKDVVSHAEAAGMRLMLWLEIERAINGTSKISKEHPEYFFPAVGRSLLTNLGTEEGWNHAFRTLCNSIDTLHTGCHRQDFNMSPTPAWHMNEAEDRVGINEMKYIEGLYRLYDALLDKYPDLVIDNCAGGGRRIDFEMCRRTLPLFRSDYQCSFNPDPDVTQAHNCLSYYLPYNGCSTKAKSDDYAARSTYAAVWGAAYWNTGFQSMDDADLKWAARISEEHRRLLPYFSCDYYCLLSDGYDKFSWAAWQYDRPEEDDGILMIFRRSKSPSRESVIPMEAVDSQATYVFTDQDTNESFTVSGREITEGAFTVVMEKPYSSKILHYAKRK